VFKSSGRTLKEREEERGKEEERRGDGI